MVKQHNEIIIILTLALCLFSGCGTENDSSDETAITSLERELELVFGKIGKG